MGISHLLSALVLLLLRWVAQSNHLFSTFLVRSFILFSLIVTIITTNTIRCNLIDLVLLLVGGREVIIIRLVLVLCGVSVPMFVVLLLLKL